MGRFFPRTGRFSLPGRAATPASESDDGPLRPLISVVPNIGVSGGFTLTFLNAALFDVTEIFVKWGDTVDIENGDNGDQGDELDAAETIYNGTTNVVGETNRFQIAVGTPGGTLYSNRPTATSYKPTVATPTFGTNGGAFSNSTTTTISCATAGASIFWRKLGSGDSWTAYSVSAGVNGTQQLETYATKADHFDSATATSNAFTFKCATPTFGTNGGSSNNDMTTTITSTTTGAGISYSIAGGSTATTTNGATVTVGASGMVSATATKANYTDSDPATSNAFALTVGTITPGTAGGTKNNDFTATFSVATTTGATKEYSYDNTTWSAYGAGQTIDRDRVYYMRATKAGYTSATASATYVMQCATPTFGTNGGSSNNDMSTTITSATTGASISYSGAAAGTGTATNGGTVSVTGSGTIAAVATKANYADSSTATSSAFTLTVGAITLGFTTATYNADFTATFTVATTTGATKEYSYDNATWSAYGAGQSIDRTRTYYARATKTGYTTATANATYTMQVATPTFSPAAGSYGSAQNVTPSTTTSGASGFYTTNGVDPTTGSAPVSGAISVAASATVKALFTRINWSNSAIGSAAYTIVTTDSDGTAYINRCSAAGNTLSSAKQLLTHAFFMNTKAVMSIAKLRQCGLWIYNNSSHDSVYVHGVRAYTMTNTSHSSKAAVCNGTNSKIVALTMNSTNFTDVTKMGWGLFFLSGTANYHGAYSSSVGSSSSCALYLGTSGAAQTQFTNGGQDINGTGGMSSGLLMGNRDGANGVTARRDSSNNESAVATKSDYAGGSHSNIDFTWGARNRESGTPDIFVNCTLAGAYHLTGATNTEARAFAGIFNQWVIDMRAAA